MPLEHDLLRPGRGAGQGHVAPAAELVRKRLGHVTCSGRRRRTENGASLIEILVVLALAGLLLAAATMTTVAWIGREAARSEVYSLQTNMQVARMEAVSRHRTCRFSVDTATRRMLVVDLNDPADTTDDITLADVTLSSKISFARPDGSTPVTLSLVTGTQYGATFGADGAVTAGAGVVSVFGGGRYEQLTLFGAGGLRLNRWNGSAWVIGS